MVLVPRHGTLIVKLADQVHAGQLQWQPFELRSVACASGWLACDYQVRMRAQPIDPRWTVQRHVRAAANAGWPCTTAAPSESRPGPAARMRRHRRWPPVQTAPAGPADL